jgi:hypothetical protein
MGKRLRAGRRGERGGERAGLVKWNWKRRRRDRANGTVGKWQLQIEWSGKMTMTNVEKVEDLDKLSFEELKEWCRTEMDWELAHTKGGNLMWLLTTRDFSKEAHEGYVARENSWGEFTEQSLAKLAAATSIAEVKEVWGDFYDGLIVPKYHWDPLGCGSEDEDEEEVLAQG